MAIELKEDISDGRKRGWKEVSHQKVEMLKNLKCDVSTIVMDLKTEAFKRQPSCMCACVCERESEREKERGRERE